MAGYAASATLRGGNLRFASWGTGTGPAGPAATEAARPAATEAARAPADAAAAGAPIDLVGRPLDQRLGDWLASLGETWSQTTFFLFDPDSWR